GMTEERDKAHSGVQNDAWQKWRRRWVRETAGERGEHMSGRLSVDIPHSPVPASPSPFIPWWCQRRKRPIDVPQCCAWWCIYKQLPERLAGLDLSASRSAREATTRGPTRCIHPNWSIWHRKALDLCLLFFAASLPSESLGAL